MFQEAIVDNSDTKLAPMSQTSSDLLRKQAILRVFYK